jgi:bacterioferritin-associated ferredoxin
VAAREGDEEASYEWVHYSLDPVSPGACSVAVRQCSNGAVTLKDMRDSFATGVDNTCNVCLWPAEEVMTHYILSCASEFEGKNICDRGLVSSFAV